LTILVLAKIIIAGVVALRIAAWRVSAAPLARGPGSDVTRAAAAVRVTEAGACDRAATCEVKHSAWTIGACLRADTAARFLAPMAAS